MGKFSDETKTLGGGKAQPMKVGSVHRIECEAYGCPMTMQVSDKQSHGFCAYHDGAPPNEVQVITKRINENKRWINAYAKMLKWNSDDWSRYENSLLTSPFCPMKQLGEFNGIPLIEPPSIYLARFYGELHDFITTGKTQTDETPKDKIEGHS